MFKKFLCRSKIINIFLLVLVTSCASTQLNINKDSFTEEALKENEGYLFFVIEKNNELPEGIQYQIYRVSENGKNYAYDKGYIVKVDNENNKQIILFKLPEGKYYCRDAKFGVIDIVSGDISHKPQVKSVNKSFEIKRSTISYWGKKQIKVRIVKGGLFSKRSISFKFISDLKSDKEYLISKFPSIKNIEIIDVSNFKISSK
jgi:hypothetical protein